MPSRKLSHSARRCASAAVPPAAVAGWGGRHHTARASSSPTDCASERAVPSLPSRKLPKLRG
ncbi:Uncharacterised protein [Mycobacteroides abscessus subsp. abscessus]|nr:Uncharacterised protein [Mycobacteroides abscessus subsp. abscessus]